MTTLEDKMIIKKESTPKGFIFYEYDEKTENLVFRALDYNVYDLQANDLIFRSVETPKGYYFDIYDSEWGKVVFLKNKPNTTDTTDATKDYVGHERVNGEWYKFYKGDDGLLHRCRVDSPVVSKDTLFSKDPTECADKPTNTSAVFHTDDQARASLALALLSRQLALVNGTWKPDWNNGEVSKSFISQVREGEFEIDWSYCTYHFLSFERRGQAGRFLEANIDLIKQAAIFL